MRVTHSVKALFLAAGVVTAAVSSVVAQSEFGFVISVADKNGTPVTDISSSEIKMSENGVANDIVKVEPYPVPVKLTIAVDNGPLSGDALSHYRAGLTGLIKGLPADVEITLMTTSPQPMMVVKPTTERDRLLRGVNAFAPQEDSPRFTDTIVEYAKRLRTEFEQTRRLDSLPVLLMVSSTAAEAVSYEVPEISQAFAFLKQRKAKVHVISVSGTHRSQGLAPINDNRQAMIGIPIAELTGGRYEALAISNRLSTLLPELGKEIGALHLRHANQLLVTVHRAGALSGPVRNPRIEVSRAGLTGLVSLDGLP